MDTTGIEHNNGNSYREPMSAASRPEAARETFGTTEQTSGKRASGAQQNHALSIDAILKFTSDIQARVKNVPYIVPCAIAGGAFALGVLASSRIVRQLVLMAGGYAVKYAIENAPKDELLEFAKKVMTSSFDASRTA